MILIAKAYDHRRIRGPFRHVAGRTSASEALAMTQATKQQLIESFIRTGAVAGRETRDARSKTSPAPSRRRSGCTGGRRTLVPAPRRPRRAGAERAAWLGHSERLKNLTVQHVVDTFQIDSWTLTKLAGSTATDTPMFYL